MNAKCEMNYGSCIGRKGSQYMSEEFEMITEEIDFRNISKVSNGNLIVRGNAGKATQLKLKEGHSLILGDTGSGKTRRELLPYMMSVIHNNESFVVNDSKNEIIANTLPYVRNKGYKVVILDFKNPDQSPDGWNPLRGAALDYKAGNRTRALRRVKSLAISVFSAIVDKEDPYWQNAAVSVFVGAAAFLMEHGEVNDVTMQAISLLIQEIMGEVEVPNSRVYEMLGPGVHRKRVRDIIFNTDEEKRSSIYQQFMILLENGSDTQRCIQSVIRTGMEPFWSYDDVIRLTNQSTFDMRAIGETPTAVYLLTSDSQRDMDALVSAFFDEVYMVNCDIADRNIGRHLHIDIHFVIDEFNSLCVIPDMQKKISTARSRGMRFLLVVQSLAALRSVYGSDVANNIIINCNSWVVMRSSESEVHHLIQERLGKIIFPSGKEEWLVTISQLNELKLGEGLLIHKGKGIFIKLPDVSEYDLPFEPLNVYISELQHQIDRQVPWSIKEYAYQKYVRENKDIEGKASTDSERISGLENPAELLAKLDAKMAEIGEEFEAEDSIRE